MAHVATEALRANHDCVITSLDHEGDQAGRVNHRWNGLRSQSVVKKPTLMVWLPLRSRANTSSS
jgi:hypothetical protein